jgi:hypothetical protein
LRDVTYRVVKITAIRCHLIANELGRQFPVMDLWWIK